MFVKKVCSECTILLGKEEITNERGEKCGVQDLGSSNLFSALLVSPSRFFSLWLCFSGGVARARARASFTFTSALLREIVPIVGSIVPRVCRGP